MSAARDAILRDAEQEAQMLRRCGYPDAEVLPQYCIGREIGPDKIMTKTVCVYAGEYRPESNKYLGLMENLARKLKPKGQKPTTGG